MLVAKRGPVLQMAGLADHLEDGAWVVVAASTSAYEGAATVGIYAANKGALVSLACCWASALGARNIRVNTLVPGPIDTNFRDFMDEDFRKHFEAGVIERLSLSPDRIGGRGRRRCPIPLVRRSRIRHRQPVLRLWGINQIMSSRQSADAAVGTGIIVCGSVRNCDCGEAANHQADMALMKSSPCHIWKRQFPLQSQRDCERKIKEEERESLDQSLIRDHIQRWRNSRKKGSVLSENQQMTFLLPDTTEAMMMRSRPINQVIGQVASDTLARSGAISLDPDIPAYSSADIYAISTHETPHTTRFGTTSVFWVTIPLVPHFMHRRLDGKDEQCMQSSYSINIVSPGSSKSIQLDQQTRNLHFFINPALIHEVASEITQGALHKLSLRPVFGERDEQLLHLLSAVKHCMQANDDASKLKMAYLSRALCVDLLNKYSLEPITPDIFKLNKVGLSSRQISLVQDHIHTCLSQTIRVSDLAKLCGYSITAFSSRFKASTSMTPYQYLIKMRVEKAKKLLATTTLSLTEVAVQTGFADQSHLTTVFRRFTGTQPAAYRKMC